MEILCKLLNVRLLKFKMVQAWGAGGDKTKTGMLAVVYCFELKKLHCLSNRHDVSGMIKLYISKLTDSPWNLKETCATFWGKPRTQLEAMIASQLEILSSSLSVVVPLSQWQTGLPAFRLSIRPSGPGHSWKRNISETLWGIFNIHCINVHSDSRMNQV